MVMSPLNFVEVIGDVVGSWTPRKFGWKKNGGEVESVRPLRAILGTTLIRPPYAMHKKGPTKAEIFVSRAPCLATCGTKGLLAKLAPKQ